MSDKDVINAQAEEIRQLRISLESSQRRSEFYRKRFRTKAEKLDAVSSLLENIQEVCDGQ